MKLPKYLILIFILTIVTACSNNTNKKHSEASIIKPELTNINLIEKAHNKSLFLSKEAIQFDFYLKFGGKDRLQGKLTFTTNSSKGLLELTNGNKIYYNQDKVFVSPELADAKSVRFDAYTWAYFFLFPYKLSDEGTQWNNQTKGEMNDIEYNINKLTFEAGTGDAPDDWYVVYSNPVNNKIEVAAYIVTANKSLEEAEKNPHAIKYTNYTIVDGVSIATSWSFWEWNKDEGLTKQIGEAKLSNVNFITPEENFFTPPNNFISK